MRSTPPPTTLLAKSTCSGEGTHHREQRRVRVEGTPPTSSEGSRRSGSRLQHPRVAGALLDGAVWLRDERRERRLGALPEAVELEVRRVDDEPLEDDALLARRAGGLAQQRVGGEQRVPPRQPPKVVREAAPLLGLRRRQLRALVPRRLQRAVQVAEREVRQRRRGGAVVGLLAVAARQRAEEGVREQARALLLAQPRRARPAAQQQRQRRGAQPRQPQREVADVRQRRAEPRLALRIAQLEPQKLAEGVVAPAPSDRLAHLLHRRQQAVHVRRRRVQDTAEHVPERLARGRRASRRAGKPDVLTVPRVDVLGRQPVAHVRWTLVLLGGVVQLLALAQRLALLGGRWRVRLVGTIVQRSCGGRRLPRSLLGSEDLRALSGLVLLVRVDVSSWQRLVGCGRRRRRRRRRLRHGRPHRVGCGRCVRRRRRRLRLGRSRLRIQLERGRRRLLLPLHQPAVQWALRRRSTLGHGDRR